MTFEMKNISTRVFFTVLIFMILSNGSRASKLKFTPVRVVGVKNGVENSFFAAVEDKESPTGWAVQVKKNMKRFDIDGDLIVYMFDNTPKTTNTTDEYYRFFTTFLCSLLIPDARYDQFPQKNNMPRDIINLIFPGRQGSCDLKEGTKPIKSSAQMNTAVYENPMVRFPQNTSYYDVYVNILTQSMRQDHEKNYLFQVQLRVGDPPKSARICLNTHWNYYIIWRVCTIAEFIESTMTSIGWRILHIF